jgi:hypothetical protein
MFRADTLQDLCLLVPKGQSQFLGCQYWLVVECDLLADDVGKWGISTETFFYSQKDFCNDVQGILLSLNFIYSFAKGSGLASTSMGYCLRNPTDCNITVYQQFPYLFLLDGNDR